MEKEKKVEWKTTLFVKISPSLNCQVYQFAKSCLNSSTNISIYLDVISFNFDNKIKFVLPKRENSR